MKTLQKKPPKDQPTSYDLFTGGKLPEFAVFYNIAFFRMAGLLNHMLGKSFELKKYKLENVFKEWLNSVRRNKDNTTDDVYSKLRRYLWKGYLTDKNKSGYQLTENDKTRIWQMLDKLLAIRNFHSHYWHDNRELEFSKDLKEFICSLHEDAKLSLSEKYARNLPDYDKNYKQRPFFKEYEGKLFITQEGRTFFLSFFLTRGEMVRFLQQRKGSKRNDKPEFKIKHEVYRYYTHREGAARHHYGFEDNILNDLPAKEQKEVLSARQGFKLNAYLNDIPAKSNDPELFPLFLNIGRQVASAKDIIRWCRENDFFASLQMRQVVKTIEREIKGKRKRFEITKDQVVEIETPDKPGYIIHIGRITLHRLILDSIRCEDEGHEFLRKLKHFINERESLVGKLDQGDFLQIDSENGKITLTEELDEYYRYKLRSGEKLRRKMGLWLDQIDKHNVNKHELALNEFKKEIALAPIELSYYDFSFEEDRKPRSRDRFTEFVAHYLIDFNVTPDWEWMVEKFDTIVEEKEVFNYNEKETVKKQVSKRILSFGKNIPKNHRLSITEGQIIVRDKAYPNFKFLLGASGIKESFNCRH